MKNFIISIIGLCVFSAIIISIDYRNRTIKSNNKSDTFEKRKPIPFKPFYVYNKVTQDDKVTSLYDCVDKNGTRFWFFDLTSKYSVGDSIK